MLGCACLLGVVLTVALAVLLGSSASTVRTLVGLVVVGLDSVADVEAIVDAFMAADMNARLNGQKRDCLDRLAAGFGQ